jgi:hypothetical protein
VKGKGKGRGKRGANEERGKWGETKVKGGGEGRDEKMRRAGNGERQR